MNQEAFLKELESLLSDIPQEERIEAMEYYRCYFEDAGEENEESVLKELGSPWRVAESIKADLYGEKKEGGFTEKGYEEFVQKDVPGVREPGTEGQCAGKQDTGERSTEKQSTGNQSTGERNTGKQSTWKQSAYQRKGRENRTARAVFLPVKILLILIMAVATVAVIAAVVGVAIGLIGANITVAAVAAALIGVGIGSFVSGAPAVGFGLFCGSAVCLAIFCLLLLAAVAFCAKALPAAIRAICRATASVCGVGRR